VSALRLSSASTPCQFYTGQVVTAIGAGLGPMPTSTSQVLGTGFPARLQGRN